MSTSPRPVGILAVAVAMFAALAVSSSQHALAQGATSLKFERPAAQGAGTPGYQVVSDPTIRPFMGPGKPATIGVTVEIDFQGNGRPDLVACYGAHPQYARASFPCRIVRPQADGSLKDITHQMFGTAALPLQESAYRMAVGDFNGDGRVDVFMGAFGHDYTPFAGATNVLLISKPDGTYADRSSTLPQVPDLTASTATADIDGDGHLDIYVGNNAVNPPGDYHGRRIERRSLFSDGTWRRDLHAEDDRVAGRPPRQPRSLCVQCAGRCRSRRACRPGARCLEPSHIRQRRAVQRRRRRLHQEAGLRPAAPPVCRTQLQRRAHRRRRRQSRWAARSAPDCDARLRRERTAGPDQSR